MNFDHFEVSKRVFRVMQVELNAIKKLADSDLSPFTQAIELILSCEGKVVMTGIGKSGIVAQKIAATLASTGTSSFFLHPAEALHGDLGMVSLGDVVVAIGKSGESVELNDLIPGLKRIGAKLVAITTNLQSTLARNSDVVIQLPQADEACPHNLAPTSSTTMSMVIGDAIAIAAMELRGFQPEDFAAFHPGGKLGRRLLTKVSDLMIQRDACGILPSRGTCMKDVLSTLTDFGIGIVVFEDDAASFCGIITDGDIRRLIQQFGNRFFDVPVAEIINRQPVHVASNILAVQALEIMESRTKPLNVLPVIEDGKLVGVLRNHEVIKLK
jgi:arabinose-5-phosphate isomerase